MSGKIIEMGSSEISSRGESILDLLFNNELVILGSMKSPNFRKQQQIHMLLSDIKDFIRSNPYAEFRIGILGEGEMELNPTLKSSNIDVEIKVRNFDYKLKSTNPSEYMMIINQTWEEVIVYQRTVDGNYLKSQIKRTNI